MKIYNTTTRKVISLKIVDRETGLEWTNDLLGNACALHYNRDREMAEMNDEDWNWWAEIIDGLDEIEDMTEQAKKLLSPKEFEELERKLNNEGNSSDYELHVSTLTTILNKVLVAQRRKQRKALYKPTAN